MNETSLQRHLENKSNALEMLSCHWVYQPFHLQKMGYLALRALGQCQVESICLYFLQTEHTRESSCGGISVWWVTEKALFDACLLGAEEMNRRATHLLYSETPKAPGAEESARKLLVWKPYTLKKCYSTYSTSPVAPCAPHSRVSQPATWQDNFPPTLEETLQTALTVPLNDKPPWDIVHIYDTVMT